jgi:hypothetical protein
MNKSSVLGAYRLKLDLGFITLIYCPESNRGKLLDRGEQSEQISIEKISVEVLEICLDKLAGKAKLLIHLKSSCEGSYFSYWGTVRLNRDCYNAFVD